MEDAYLQSFERIMLPDLCGKHMAANVCFTDVGRVDTLHQARLIKGRR